MLEEIDSAIKGLENAEVFIYIEKNNNIEIEDNKLVGVKGGVVGAVSVRVERNKRLGIASSTIGTKDLKEIITSLYEEAIKISNLAQEIPWWEGFPSSKCQKVAGIYSPSLENVGIGELEDIAKGIEFKEGYSLSSSISVGSTYWAIANTEGTAFEERSTQASMTVSVSKKEGGYTSKSVWDVFTSHAKLPEPSEVTSKLFEEAAALRIRPKRIEGEKELFFDPRASAELLDFLIEMFMADEVAKGHSPLASSLGKKAFSEKLSVDDHPRLSGGPSSHGCDHEGVRSEPLTLIEKGVVKGFLADLMWGYKLGIEKGRGFREDPFSKPSPTYTNLIVRAGNASEEGVKVLGLTGLHTASPETGYMSVVLSPAFYEGEHVEAVLSANVLDLLNEGLLDTGKEGRWVGSIYTPGLLLRARLT
ncbi:hypothetical protein EYM_02175 [Ignicoccus islandicus DSM 13165]|uniref:Peptidase U62 modulator of DNA gyrase n=1 Tax=Ignicoccus islandicus DSM 13165 TaxID=940295 RepID=A0A0U3FKA5_9CREN|nr:TldD/PmbA family protein [Ignicoccus islandicus]ALU12294.1 hypothetical protein EYM_02175 [Ignicoccus islandicus DSM 13165]